MSSIDEFTVETYDDNEFNQDELENEMEGSQHMAFEIKQQKARESNNPESEHHNEIRKVKKNIINNFDQIQSALENFTNRDKSSYMIGNVQRKSIIQKIMSCLYEIGMTTELNWNDLSRFKETLGYRFGARDFPDEERVKNSGWTKSFNSNSEFSGASSDANASAQTAAAADADTKSPEQRRKEIEDMKQRTRELVAEQYNLPGSGIKNFMDRNFVDEKHNRFGFTILNPSEFYDTISMSEIEYLFELCFKEKLYSIMLALWCHLVCSKYFAHHVLNSERVLDYIFNPDIYTQEVIRNGKVKISVKNPFLDDEYKEIIYHCLFYGVYILTREEFTAGIKTTDRARHVLDLRVIQKIPPYSGSYESNPFIPTTLSNKYIFEQNVPAKNLLIRPIRQSNDYRGVYSHTSAWSRFHIMTDNLFKDFNLNGFFITGSAISACITRNPLERLFKLDLPRSKDDIFASGNASQVRVYWNSKSKELKEYLNEYYPSKSAINTENLTDVQIAELENKLSDIDIIVESYKDSEFDMKSFAVFNHLKAEITARLNRAPSNSELNIIKITTQMSYKYTIVGRELDRTIDLFRIFETHPAGCVSRFHFGIVRAYFEGSRIKVLPTMWCAAQSGVGVDYKWLSNSSMPQKLVCKYYLRGARVLLNETEHKNIREFVSNNSKTFGIMDEFPQHSEDSGDSSDSDDSSDSSDSGESETSDPADERESTVSIMNPIFHPRMNYIGLWKEIAEIVEVENIKPVPAFKWIRDYKKIDSIVKQSTVPSNFGFEMRFRYPAGHIRPIKLWHINAYATALSESSKYFIIV